MNTGGLKFMVAAAMVMGSGCATPVTESDGIERPFAAAGDPTRGREVFVSREGGHCVICHAVPDVAASGDVGPPLAGIGSRLGSAQIRLRVADITRVNRDAVMPSFHRVEGLRSVAPEHRGRPLLSAQQVEDVVAWLATLK